MFPNEGQAGCVERSIQSDLVQSLYLRGNAVRQRIRLPDDDGRVGLVCRLARMADERFGASGIDIKPASGREGKIPE